MKNIVIIFFLFLTLGAYADVPQWFLYPNKGEYVGVSLPNDNKNTAVVSALLAYAAQNIRKGENITDDVFPIRYTIARQYINNEGEIFVALHIQESDIDSLRYKISTMTDYSIAKANESTPLSIMWNQMEKLYLYYNNEITYAWEMRDESSLTQPTITVYCRGNGSEKYFVGEQNNKWQYADQSETIFDLSWHVSCAQSLHVAYMRGLIGTLSKKMHVDYPMAIRNNKLIMNVK